MNDKHIRRFIKLSTTIFVLVGVGHTLRIGYDWSLEIGGFAMPMYISYLVVFMLVCMVIMGMYYLRK